jgi:hypothetical protein
LCTAGELDGSIGGHLHSKHREIVLFRRRGLDLLRDWRKGIVGSHSRSCQRSIGADTVCTILTEAASISERHGIHGR